MKEKIPCNKCRFWFYEEKGLKIHIAKLHTVKKYTPDLILMGIVKRKLTSVESAQITKEVMSMGINDADLRFKMAVLKAINITYA